MRKISVSLLIILLVSGCASAPKQANNIRPIIDTSMLPEDRDMEKDILECNVYANAIKKPAQNAVDSGLAGVALGAGAGALIGYMMGVNPASTAAWGGLSGGVSGAASGAAYSALSRHQVVSNCMTKRGYAVLN